MNTGTRKFSAQKENTAKMSISFRLVLIIASFVIALLGSWSLEGLFFTELFISGIIVCALMWTREVSLKIEKEHDAIKTAR